MPISFNAVVQPLGFAPRNEFVEWLRASSHSACWSSKDLRASATTMFEAIWMLAPTHHSNVCCGTKSPSRYRFSANAVAGGGVGAWVGRGVGAAVGRGLALGVASRARVAATAGVGGTSAI